MVRLAMGRAHCLRLRQNQTRDRIRRDFGRRPRGATRGFLDERSPYSAKRSRRSIVSCREERARTAALGPRPETPFWSIDDSPTASANVRCVDAPLGCSQSRFTSILDEGEIASSSSAMERLADESRSYTKQGRPGSKHLIGHEIHGVFCIHRGDLFLKRHDRLLPAGWGGTDLPVRATLRRLT